MTNESYLNIKTLIINILSRHFSFRTLKKRRKNFIINAFICFSSIKGKINFLQMERFEQRLGAGGASTTARTGAKLANSYKLSGELLPRLRQTQVRCR